MLIDVPVTLYNMGPADRYRLQLRDRTIHTLAQTVQPGGINLDPRVRGGVLVLVETIGYGDLPEVHGMALHRDRTGGPYGGESRANVSVYVHHSLPWRWMRWEDHRCPWPRTEHPGTHPSRSTQVHRIGRVDLRLGHAPPLGHGTSAARAEWYDATGDHMAPWTTPGWAAKAAVWRQAARLRPRATVADFNPGSDRSPVSLAARVGGAVVGKLGPDRAVIRGCYATEVRYRRTVAGLELPTDHEHGALTFCLRIPGWALPSR